MTFIECDSGDSKQLELRTVDQQYQLQCTTGDELTASNYDANGDGAAFKEYVEERRDNPGVPIQSGLTNTNPNPRTPEPRVKTKPGASCTDSTTPNDSPPGNSGRREGIPRPPVVQTNHRPRHASKVRREFLESREKIAKDLVKYLDEQNGAGVVGRYYTRTTGQGIKIQWPPQASLEGRSGRGVSGKADLEAGMILLSQERLTDIDRLRVVVAHEYCHLAAWVYHEADDHGPHWRQWARNISSRFLPPHLHITKYIRNDIVRNFHFYCTKCGNVEKLNTKPRTWRIDMECYKCGNKGTFEQYEPPPEKLNPWNLFTHLNTPKIKKLNPNATPEEVRRIVRDAYWRREEDETGYEEVDAKLETPRVC
ncbi:SprT-like family-domain-containing protein [Trichophaea hybrida]|nr:SprT-like family-domain-containing protein [Trichophaea hybrida]